MSSPLLPYLTELAAPRPGLQLSAPQELATPGVAPTPAAGTEAVAPGEPRLWGARPASVGGQGARSPAEAPGRACPWRLVSRPGSRLTWRGTRSVLCLR